MKTKLLSLVFAGMLALAMIGGAVFYGTGTADAAAEVETNSSAATYASDESAADYGKGCPLSGHR